MRSLKLALLVLATACGGSDSTPDAAVVQMDAPKSDSAINTTTSLVATFMATRTINRAYYGVNTNGSLHVEAYLGGDPGCPTMNSGTTDYTLIIANLNAVTTTASSSFLDFIGDMLPTAAPESATAVTLTSFVYANGLSVTFDATLTFPSGTVTGHLYATHCDSLDG